MIMFPMNPEAEDQWKMIQETFLRSMPPHIKAGEYSCACLKHELVSRRMHAYLFVGKASLKAVAITRLDYDPVLDRKNLLLYSAAALEKLTPEDWAGCFKLMSDYAQKIGCTHIVALSVVPKIIEMAVLMGGNADMKYLSIPLGGE